MNTFQKTWMIVSTIFGAIGLVNVTEDIHKWAPFFIQLITQYKMIWYFLFNWIPLNVMDWVKDYLFFGILYFGSFIREYIKVMEYQPFIIKLLGGIIFTMIVMPIWPIHLLRQLIVLLKKKKDRGYPTDLRVINRLGSTLLLFFVFLVANIIVDNLSN